jgi:hypothetical protein
MRDRSAIRIGAHDNVILSWDFLIPAAAVSSPRAFLKRGAPSVILGLPTNPHITSVEGGEDYFAEG